MAFDIKTAKPVSEVKEKVQGGFDISTAKKVGGKETVDDKIKKRGTIQADMSDIAKQFTSGGLGGKALAALRISDKPRQLLESAVANPLLSVQKGNVNPAQLMKEFVSGISGQKLGQIGDVGRAAGYGEIPSAAMGLMLGGVTPLTAARKAQKFFGSVAKWSDKGILKAGDSLIKASDEAISVMGKETEKAFSTVANSTASGKEALSIYKMFKKSPQLMSIVEEELGMTLPALLKSPTVTNIRKVKQIVGDYRPGAFGKETRGLAENIEAKYINSLYSELKNTMANSVKRSHGEKLSDSIMQAEKAFTKTKRATQYIRKTITDPVLKEPTKGGEMAKKIALEGDVSGRKALNMVKEASKVSRKEINRAVDALQAFNAARTAAELSRKAAQAAVFGGAIGGLGGYIGGKVYNRESD